MKVRTFLLFSCMIVVPGLAMFSHRVPAEVRSATRCALWDPIQAWAEGWTKPDSGANSGRMVGRGDTATAESEDAAGLPQDPLSGVPEWAADQQRSPAIGQLAEGPAGRLAALGAGSVDCRPLDPQAGRHVASCRVPIDASGQLHRVFQAAGGSPQEAVASLADQVEAWRDRLAARASTSGNSGGGSRF